MKDQIVIQQQMVAPEINEIIERITYALTELDTKKSKMKANRELIDEMLKNDPAYAQVLETFEAEKMALKKEKDAILGSSEAAEYLEIQDKLKQEISDLQDTLSPALEVLYQKTKSTDFTDATGKKRRILKKFTIAAGQQKMF
jgi:predicted transposase YdaD